MVPESEHPILETIGAAIRGARGESTIPTIAP